jgi:hypothetical protein
VNSLPTADEGRTRCFIPFLSTAPSYSPCFPCVW